MFQNKNLSAIKRNLLFQGVNETNLKFKFNLKEFIEIGEGEIIYKPGDTSDGLYLLIEGEVKLKIPGALGNTSILQKTSNDFFGEKEVQQNTVRKSFAVANKNTLLYIIRKSELTSMTQRSKELRYNLIGDLNDDNEPEAKKKVTGYNGLLKKLSEQSFFKSENTESNIETNYEEPEITIKEEEENIHEKEFNSDTELFGETDLSIESEVGNENNLNGSDEYNIEDLNKTIDETSSASIEKQELYTEPTSISLSFVTNALLKIFSVIMPEEILITIPEAISALLNAESGALYIINKETKELQTQKRQGAEYSVINLQSSWNLFAEVINDGKTINLINPSEDQVAFIELTQDKKIDTMLIFPIKDTLNNIIGVLQLINSKKNGFNSNDEKLLNEISPLVALALKNSANVQKSLNSDRLLSLNKIANFLMHDIENPIVNIRQYSEHLKKQRPNNEVSNVLDLIIEQTNCVLDLVQTTLGYSEGKSICNPQPILLTLAMDSILTMLAEYVEGRGVKLFKKFEGDGIVNLDKKEFYQACYQITKNACDAMPKGGNFYITTRKEGDKIRIEFKDNGPGIPDSIRARIFEPFMAFGKNQKSGLGLTIAEKIINEHNGMIRAENEPGAGAVFIIVLPVLS